MVNIGNVKLGGFPLLLAPMEDISDPPFRKLCKENGADLMFTEFISSEGLIRNASKSTQKLDIYEEERPIGIQIFGNNIRSMKEAAKITEKTCPDIIDINYGCPVKKIACKGSGAGILQNIPKMVKMTAEIVKTTQLPVTVKTRLGWDSKTQYIVDVAERLQDVGIKAISIHGRTRKQMYKGEACWDLIRKVKENPRMNIPVFGNGDVSNPEIALEKKRKYGVDGIMIGRAAIGYPWIFNEIKHYFKTGSMPAPPTIKQRVKMCKQHFKKALEWKGEKLGIVETRKHYANYFKGIPDFKHYKIKLVTSFCVKEIEDTLNEIELNFCSVNAF